MLKVLLLQLEISLGPMLTACRRAVERGCRVVLKAAPMHDKMAASKAEALLDHGVSLCFVNEVEAARLLSSLGFTVPGLGNDEPLSTVEHAECAANEMLQRWRSLQAVVVTCLTAHVIVERSEGSWLRATDISRKSVRVLPRKRDDKVIDVIGAAE